MTVDEKQLRLTLITLGVTTLRRRLSNSRMNGVRFDSGPQR